MKKSLLKAGMLSVAGAVLVVGLVFALRGEAQARQPYMKEFKNKYTKVAENNKITCAACHGEDKKVRNDYGQALGAALGGKDVKDAAKIVEALGKAEAGKSATDGKTFGDLLKDGKLPGKS